MEALRACSRTSSRCPSMRRTSCRCGEGRPALRTHGQFSKLGRAEMVKDSLFALSKRITQLQSIVNREISLVNLHMGQALDGLTDRETGIITTNQQYVMTSFNNLALLLDDVLQQMQNESSCNKPGTGNCEKPGGSGSKPSPSAKQIKGMQQCSPYRAKEKRKASTREREARGPARVQMAAQQAYPTDDPSLEDNSMRTAPTREQPRGHRRDGEIEGHRQRRARSAHAGAPAGHPHPLLAENAERSGERKKSGSRGQRGKHRRSSLRASKNTSVERHRKLSCCEPFRRTSPPTTSSASTIISILWKSRIGSESTAWPK